MSEFNDSVLDDDGPDALGESNLDESSAAEVDNRGIGDNSQKLKNVIIQCAREMVSIDEERKVQNRLAADIREVLGDNGVDKEAFKEAYSYYKKKRHEREGFDDSSKLCHEALSDPEQKSLFDILEDNA